MMIKNYFELKHSLDENVKEKITLLDYCITSTQTKFLLKKSVETILLFRII